ncbi:MAG: hypothetical protein OQK93_07605 [Gammaproteobacteria bacterium]|jgi:hypothetical protein|nr:hypothetical protein [Gammaproteobacteria bacterium]
MKRYTFSLILGIGIMLLSVSFVNWLINPYDIFESPDIDGINSYKSEVGRHTRLSRVYQVNRVEPEVILLASSRGLVVPESLLSLDGLQGLNLSLPSASTYELLRMMQHANAVRPLKKAVLALDESFSGMKQPGFVESRLSVHSDNMLNKDAWLQEFRDRFQSLLSFDALRSSIRTITNQKEDPESGNSERYHAERVRNAGGHRQMFRNMEASLFSDFKGNEDKCNAVDERSEPGESEYFIYFKKIVELAYRDKIDLYIYFSPIHARLYEAECMLGMRGAYSSMKRQVVTTVETIAHQYGVDPYPVWDFSGYNEVTTENIPEINNTDEIMTWYWEGSHYTKETSNEIFNRIFDNEGYLAGFGTRITTNNIDAHLVDIDMQRLIYLRSHQDDIAELHELFRESRLVH